MSIRKAIPGDVNAIYDLGQPVDEFTVNDETVNFWPKDLLASAVQSDDALILIAEDSGIIIGFLIVNYNNSLKKALIENIYVQPDKRGQGVGDKLLEHMFKLLPEMGCEYVATLVPPDAQGAIDLYGPVLAEARHSCGWIKPWVMHLERRTKKCTKKNPNPNSRQSLPKLPNK